MHDTRTNYELIRDTLLKMDPETRTEVVAAMEAIRQVPIPVAVRILANPRAIPMPILRGACGA